MTYTRRPRPKITAPPDDTWDSVYRVGGKPLHYNRAGQPCSMREWAETFENIRTKFVARDTVLGAWVATIYDGLDHDLVADDGPPTMFETTVFRKGRFGPRRSGRELPEHLDGYRIRYGSERDAVAGHREIRKMVREVQQELNGPPPLAVTVTKRRRRR